MKKLENKADKIMELRKINDKKYRLNHFSIYIINKSNLNVFYRYEQKLKEQMRKERKLKKRKNEKYTEEKERRENIDFKISKIK